MSNPLPRHQVVTSAKDAVTSGMTAGVVGLARQSRRWSVELKRSMSHAVDVVLGKSEELVDHFLPMTEEELGEACVPIPTPSRPKPSCPGPIPGGHRAESFEIHSRPHGRSAGNEELGPRPDCPLCFRGPPACTLLETRPSGPQEYKQPIDWRVVISNWWPCMIWPVRCLFDV